MNALSLLLFLAATLRITVPYALAAAGASLGERGGVVCLGHGDAQRRRNEQEHRERAHAEAPSGCGLAGSRFGRARRAARSNNA